MVTVEIVINSTHVYEEHNSRDYILSACIVPGGGTMFLVFSFSVYLVELVNSLRRTMVIELVEAAFLFADDIIILAPTQHWQAGKSIVTGHS